MLPYIYFIKVIACSGILFTYYFLVLRNQAYHRYNRFYLLFAFALSWVIPVLPFSVVIQEKNVTTPVYNAISYISVHSPGAVKVASESTVEHDVFFTSERLFLWIYTAVSLVMFVLFIHALMGIYKLQKKYAAQRRSSYTLFLTTEENAPFSFFRSVFWNTNIDMESRIGRQILQHEITHIEDRHTHDKIFLSLNMFFGWFNPIFWIMKKELMMIHEFIADRKSVPDADTEVFAQMLLNTAFSGRKSAITNSFFFSPVKRRLFMLKTAAHSKFSYVQRIVALPVLMVLVLVLSLKTKDLFAVSDAAYAVSNNLTHANLQGKFKVVIDAGHGGDDHGGRTADGTSEKDVVLELAKMIRELAKGRSLEVILTRNSDEAISLEDRASFANQIQPDLLLSLHCNGGTSGAGGYEVYSITNSKNSVESSTFAEYLSNNLNREGADRSKTGTRNGIFILQETNCPAVLMEAGLDGTSGDLKNFNDEKVLQATAVRILDAIEDYVLTRKKEKK